MHIYLSICISIYLSIYVYVYECVCRYLPIDMDKHRLGLRAGFQIREDTGGGNAIVGTAVGSNALVGYPGGGRLSGNTGGVGSPSACFACSSRQPPDS